MAANLLAKPLSWEELFPGRFMKAADFKGKKVTMTIDAVDLERIEGEKGEETKGIISFRGRDGEKVDKQWVINRTNATCLMNLFGRAPQNWVGKRVTLYAMPISLTMNPDVSECIRVWGSPDIDADRTISVRLPRKKAQQMTMHKVVLKGENPNGTASGTPIATEASAA